jgi:hypothetical protein
MLDKNLKSHQIFALQRYLCWATSFRVEYALELPKYKFLLDDERDSDAALIEFFVSPAGRSLMFWCSMLWVVYEGWKDCKLSDPSIEALEDKVKLGLLREFRNATFHYQKEYFTHRHFNLIAHPDVEKWIVSLHESLSRHLADWSAGLGVSQSPDVSPHQP